MAPQRLLDAGIAEDAVGIEGQGAQAVAKTHHPPPARAQLDQLARHRPQQVGRCQHRCLFVLVQVQVVQAALAGAAHLQGDRRVEQVQAVFHPITITALSGRPVAAGIGPQRSGQGLAQQPLHSPWLAEKFWHARSLSGLGL